MPSPGRMLAADGAPGSGRSARFVPGRFVLGRFVLGRWSMPVEWASHCHSPVRRRSRWPPPARSAFASGTKRRRGLPNHALPGSASSSAEGCEQLLQCALRQVPPQHQAQPGGALRNCGWSDRDRKQTGLLQLLLKVESVLVPTDQQGENWSAPWGARPALVHECCSPEFRALAQLGSPGRVGLDQVQGGLGPSHQRWRQGRGVTEGSTGLKQPFHRGVIPCEKSASAAESFPKGAADQSHRLSESMAKPAAFWTQHA